MDYITSQAPPKKDPSLNLPLRGGTSGVHIRQNSDFNPALHKSNLVPMAMQQERQD